MMEDITGDTNLFPQRRMNDEMLSFYYFEVVMATLKLAKEAEKVAGQVQQFSDGEGTALSRLLDSIDKVVPAVEASLIPTLQSAIQSNVAHELGSLSSKIGSEVREATGRQTVEIKTQLLQQQNALNNYFRDLKWGWILLSFLVGLSVGGASVLFWFNGH